LSLSLPRSQVLLQIALPTLYDTWSDPFLTNPPDVLFNYFLPIVSRLYHEMEQTFKKFVLDFESLHRSAINGSANKFFTDPAEKSAVSNFLKVRKDKDNLDAKQTLLAKISTFALSKAATLWEEVYMDSIYAPFIRYTCEIFGIRTLNFTSFPDNFPLASLKQLQRAAAFEPSELTKELRLKDASAKSQVGLLVTLCYYILYANF